MKTKLFYLFFVLAIMISAAGVAARTAYAQSDEPIDISSEAEGEDEEQILLEFADPDQTAAVYYLFLRNTSAEALNGLTFALANLKERSSGKLAGGYNVIFKIGDEQVVAEGVAVEAGQTLVLRMELDNFTHTGEYAGSFLVKAAGRTVASSQFEVRRIPASTPTPTPTEVATPTATPNPTLSIAGFDSTGITLTQVNNEETYSFQIYGANDTRVENVKIVLENFTKEGSAAVVPSQVSVKDANGSEIRSDGGYTVEGLDHLVLNFRLALPEEGDYVGRVRLSYNRGQAAYQITVKRVRQAIPVEVIGLGDTLQGNSFHSFPVRFYLHENRGSDFYVNPPTLVLNRAESDVITKAELAISPPVMMCATPTALDASTQIKIKAMDYQCIEMNLQNMCRGEYNGQLLVSSQNGLSVARNLKILVRHPASLALVTLLGGIGLSFLIRWILNTWMPVRRFQVEVWKKIEVVRNLKKKLDRAGKDQYKPEKELLDELEHRLDDITVSVDSTNFEAMKTDVADYQKTLDDFCKLVDLANALAWLPEDLRAEYDPQRKSYLKLLADVKESENARSMLQTLRQEKIPAALKDWFAERVGNQGFGLMTEWILTGNDKATAPGEELTKQKTDFLESLKPKIEPGENLEITLRSFWNKYRELLRWISQYSLENNPKLKQDGLENIKERLQAFFKASNYKEFNAEKITKLHDQYIQILKDYAKAVIKGKGNLVREFAPPPLELLSSPATVIRDPEAEIRKLNRQINTVQAVIKFIAAIIAAVTGLVILYQPNLTWGLWQDYLIALLWGLGLYEASSTTLSGFNKFKGLEDMLTQLKTSS